DCRPVSTIAELYVGAFRKRAFFGVTALMREAISRAVAGKTRIFIWPDIVRQTSRAPEKIKMAVKMTAVSLPEISKLPILTIAYAIKGTDPT
ncbi:hypothetical protein OFN33_27765, partial [Escherichia coli]|nr:hypothetical protein [Escherichia coli]